MPLTKAVFLAAVTVGTVVVGSSGARADVGRQLTKSECSQASEAGQVLRHAGRLHYAEAQFYSCSVPSCPDAVKEDCVRQLDEVRRAIPSLVVIVKDETGRLISDARIAIDGASTVDMDRQEGAVVHADPGAHTFTIRADGYQPLQTSFVLKEGIKDREVSVILSPVQRGPEVETPLPRSSSPLRTMSYVALGTGAIGLGLGVLFGIRAGNVHDEAVAGCTPVGDGFRCSDPASRVQRENDAAGFGNAATLSVVIGAVFAIGGAALLLAAPSNAAPARSGAAYR